MHSSVYITSSNNPIKTTVLVQCGSVAIMLEYCTDKGGERTDTLGNSTDRKSKSTDRRGRSNNRETRRLTKGVRPEGTRLLTGEALVPTGGKRVLIGGALVLIGWARVLTGGKLAWIGGGGRGQE